jgi:hypothetical protein
VITDQGGNLEFGGSSCPGGFFRGDPRLGVLSDHGGPTPTIALQPGSAAIRHVRTCVLSTDQRGVGRPVGAPCDSGAYEVAPPGVSGIAVGSVTTSSASVAAAVNPNLQDSRVIVNYGRTPSYGSSTPPRDLGAGNSPVPFTAALGGLTPGATYHFDIVATNADGQSTTSDGTFTTLPPLGASIARATTVGPALSLTIECAGGSGPGRCGGTVHLTTREAVKSAHTAKHKRGRHGPKARLVGAGSYSVASGSKVTVRINLNQMGRKLLGTSYVLPTTVSVRGTTSLTRRVTFRYPVIKSLIIYTISVARDGSSSMLSQLTVTHVPRGGKVTVNCHGAGCPFGERAFAPRHGLVVAARPFRHSRLGRGASVRVEVLAANQVGKVLILVPRSGPSVSAVSLCLPPGAARPARCVKNAHH